MLEINSAVAIEHPDLCSFLHHKGIVCRNRLLHLNDLEDAALTPFQDNLIISRRLDGGRDFVFDYWGEENTLAYGFDLTGTTILGANFGDLANLFLTIDCQVISSREAVYLNGVFDWMDKDRQYWYRIALPLMGPEGLERVISYTSFRKHGG